MFKGETDYLKVVYLKGVQIAFWQRLENNSELYQLTGKFRRW